MILSLLIDGKDLKKLEISTNSSTSEVSSAFWALLDVPEAERASHVLKLYRADGVFIPIGPHIPPSEEPYSLRLKRVSPLESSQIESLKLGKNVVDEIHEIRKNLLSVKSKIEQLDAFNNAYIGKERKVPLEQTQIKQEKEEHIQPFFVSPDVLEEVKKPTFDVWKFKENELIYIFLEIFKDLGLLDAFSIDRPTLIKFLSTVKRSYNPNPFHNFRHSFCVTQMMYAIINVTGVREKLSALELLILVVSCIGHDLDHPGTNNAYQVNAMTDLAIIYNDSSPLENHHAAMLFMILKKPETNILSGLNPTDFKEARKLIITCILSTDMAKHGEIIAKFKSFIDTFSYEDVNHKTVLLQMIIKCSDISNEVRPNAVADTWVDNLLEEFFSQSDKEKAEGLPTAPFMDRQKVTKPSAQVGFIGFVMVPLYETLAKVLPNMDAAIIQPIKNAQKYYQGLVDKAKSATA